MAGITRGEEVLREHIFEYAPFSASFTTFVRPVKTAGGNVFAFAQMSRIFFDFSCKSSNHHKTKRKVRTVGVKCGQFESCDCTCRTEENNRSPFYWCDRHAVNRRKPSLKSVTTRIYRFTCRRFPACMNSI